MPDISTEQVIATTTATGTSGITFNSISNTYTDIKVIVTCSGTIANVGMRFNGETATNYSTIELSGNGSAASSVRTTSFGYMRFDYNGATSTLGSMFIADIFSYAGSTNKTVLIEASEDNNGSGYVSRAVGLWRNTSAINSITVFPTSGTMSSMTVTLYGIL